MAVAQLAIRNCPHKIWCFNKTWLSSFSFWTFRADSNVFAIHVPLITQLWVRPRENPRNFACIRAACDVEDAVNFPIHIYTLICYMKWKNFVTLLHICPSLQSTFPFSGHSSSSVRANTADMPCHHAFVCVANTLIGGSFLPFKKIARMFTLQLNDKRAYSNFFE